MARIEEELTVWREWALISLRHRAFGGKPDVRRARTAGELECAFRLRYRVCLREMHDKMPKALNSEQNEKERASGAHDF